MTSESKVPENQASAALLLYRHLLVQFTLYCTQNNSSCCLQALAALSVQPVTNFDRLTAGQVAALLRAGRSPPDIPACSTLVRSQQDS